MKSKIIIGWREWVGLPDLGIDAIKAKIDTGAKTSCLHAYHPRRFVEQGAPWVAFAVHPVQRRRHPEVECRAPIVDEREVTSSTGTRQRRLVVGTSLVMGPVCRQVELTLTNRDEMGFRMLVGRQALEDQFIVDAAESYGLGDGPARPRKKKAKEPMS